MKLKPLFLTAGATVSALCFIFAYQNCAGHSSSDSTVNASSCLATSVMSQAFPQDHTFYLPMGTTNTPHACVNSSVYDTLVFDSLHKTLVLEGSSGSITLNLETGGSPCGAHNTTGGDNWRAPTGVRVDTVLSGSALTVTTTDSEISCTVNY